jgi:peroxiredoxin
MPVVVAVLIVLATLTLLNLLLTFGVIRKLRAQEQATVRPPVTLPVGAPVPDLTVSTTGGDLLSLAALRASGGLVAFLAPDCSGCQEQLPSARSALAEALDTPMAVLIVLTRLRPDPDRAEQERAELVAALDVLDSRAAIVHEPLDGALQSAFQVAAFPAFYLVDTDGRVAGVSNSAAQLPGLFPGRDVVSAGR